MSRAMKDSGVEWIGAIPAEWDVQKLKTFADIINGYSFKSELYTTEGINVIRITNVDDGSINIDNRRYYDESFSSEIGESMLQEDDILMTLTGNVGYVGIVTKKILPAGLNQRVACLRIKDRRINNKYLFYQFYNNQFRKIAMLNANGTAQLNMSTEWLKSQSFLIPQRQEQERIISFLDDKCYEIDNIISRTQDSIDEYKKYKQAIITETVTKGLNPNITMKKSGIEYIGEIPSHWLIRRLRFLGLCQNGISKGGEAFGSGFPFVSYGDVYKNYSLPENVDGLIESTETDREIYSVKRGDVFFTITSETIEEVGFTSTCLKNIDNATFAGFVIRFRPFDESMLLPEYSKFYFRSEMHRRFFVKEMNLVTRASLSQELLKKLPVILPPLEEQEAIAKYLEEKCGEIDRLIEKKQAFITEMENYKKSLIYEYVTGKKEVANR